MAHLWAEDSRDTEWMSTCSQRASARGGAVGTASARPQGGDREVCVCSVPLGARACPPLVSAGPAPALHVEEHTQPLRGTGLGTYLEVVAPGVGEPRSEPLWIPRPVPQTVMEVGCSEGP